MPARTREFVEMAERRCRELLGSTQVGRLAWQSADGLQILPVSYVYHQGDVVFRTSPSGALSHLVRPTEVVMEVDDLDQTLRTGWSVVVHGRTAALADPVTLGRASTVDVPTPWAPGGRDLFIQITPTRISGRSLQSGWE
jgi:nitroimidazol reductase NimA-like FMN-containing flavoprotein (pyridoxamine 5'-phosphate oxidase superfamily)